MLQFKAFSPEHSANHYFVVRFEDPSNGRVHNFIVHSFCDDAGLVAGIIKYSTKYPFTIAYMGTSEPKIEGKVLDTLSLNAAISKFRRMQFFKEVVVDKIKVIHYKEKEFVEL